MRLTDRRGGGGETFCHTRNVDVKMLRAENGSAGSQKGRREEGREGQKKEGKELTRAGGSSDVLLTTFYSCRCLLLLT